MLRIREVRRPLPALAGCALLVQIAGSAESAPPVELGGEPMWQTDGVQRIGAVSFGDANRDGLLDLAAGAYQGGSTPAPLGNHIFFGDGGRIETAASWSSDDEGWTTSLAWVLLGDEPFPDLVGVNGGPGSAPTVIYRSAASGLETLPSWLSEAPGEGSGYNLALGDVNSDGVPDLFVSNICFVPCESAVSEGNISTLGMLPVDRNWTSEVANQWSGIALGDLDRSSVEVRTHQVTADGTARVFWLPQAPLHALLRVLVDRQPPGPLTYDPRSGYVHLSRAPAAGSTVEFLYETASAADLVLSSRPGSGELPVGIFIHPNTGTEPARTASEMRGSPTDRYRHLALVDLDLDGHLDLLAAGAGDAPLVAYRNQGGTLEETPSWTAADVERTAEDIVLADLNGDGFFDLATVEFTGDPAVRVYVNREGVLEREPSTTIPYFGASIASVGAGDMDGDGMSELVLGLAGAPIRAYRNLGAPPAAPTVTAVDPAEVPAGTATTISIQGSGFRAPVRVYAGDVALPAVVTGDGTLSVELPDDMTEGTHDLVVVNPDLQAAVAADALAIGDAGSHSDAGPGGDGDEDSGGGCGCRSGGPGAGDRLLLFLFLVAVASTRCSSSARTLRGSSSRRSRTPR